MNKQIIAFLLSLFTAALLCGCGKEEKRDTVTENSEVTIRFSSILSNGSDSEITSEILRNFTSRYSYVTLHYTVADESEAYKLSLLDSATYRKNPPDIVYCSLSSLGDMPGEEYVSIEEIRKYREDFASDISENALLKYSDTAYGVAVRGSGKVLVVNTELVSDYTDFRKSAEEISDSDVYLFADNALDSELFFEYMMTMYTDSKISPRDPQPHWESGFKLFSDLVRLGVFAPGDRSPAELFSEGKAVYAVLTESEASSLSGEKYRCAAFFGGFDEGLFISRSAFSSPMKRQLVLELAKNITDEKSRYAEGYIPSDGSGVFFSLPNAYPMTPCSEIYGEGCWDEVLSSLVKGENPKEILKSMEKGTVSDSDA